MEEYVKEAIYIIYGIALLISWIVLLVIVVKIKNKLYEKSTIPELLNEAELSEMVGDKQIALRYLYKVLITEWYAQVEARKILKEVGNLEVELRAKYQTLIERNGGKWPEKFTLPVKDHTLELNTLKAYLDNGAFTQEEYAEEKAKILNAQ